MYLIDVGSSTIKVNKWSGKKLSLVLENSIYFKNDFSKETGYSEANKKQTINFFKSIVKEFELNNTNTEIYATGIHRELPSEKLVEWQTEFKKKTGLNFTVISHDDEISYLEKAMELDYNNRKVLIINMGGKTTELVTYDKNKPTKRQKLLVGVADLLNNFPNVNDKISNAKIEEICNFVKERIKDEKFDTNYDCAIFTGGELRFEKLSGYKLDKNDLFNQPEHPYKVSFENFVKGNERIFYKLTMQDLYNLMPQNPKWMDGARPGAVLPQAIFEKAKITTIVPSDLNLINGVVNAKFKK